MDKEEQLSDNKMMHFIAGCFALCGLASFSGELTPASITAAKQAADGMMREFFNKSKRKGEHHKHAINQSE